MYKFYCVSKVNRGHPQIANETLYVQNLFKSMKKMVSHIYLNRALTGKEHVKGREKIVSNSKNSIQEK